MKLCETCIYQNKSEYEKPCIGYRDGCGFYEKEKKDMTDYVSILEDLKTALYVGLNGVQEQNEIDKALDMAIKALEQEPCGDVISRQAVDDLFQRAIESKSANLAEYWKKLIWVREHIKELPPVNPQEPTDTWSIKDVADTFKKHGLIVEQEPKTGHWKRISIDKYSEHAKYWYRCDRCGKDNLGNTDWCPNCGCRMVEPQESEEE